MSTPRPTRPGPRTIVRFAQEHQITQIVIGSSQRGRWQQLTSGGSNVTRVIREADPLGIDVHVIALRKQHWVSRLSRRRRAAPAGSRPTGPWQARSPIAAVPVAAMDAFAPRLS